MCLPKRCVPVLCLDVNSKLGLVAGPGGSAPVGSGSVGPSNPGVENYSGAALRLLMEELGLVAGNTFEGSGDTYFSGSHSGTSSRIDFVCVPMWMLSASMAHTARLYMKSARRLQLAAACRPIDHIPVAIRVCAKTLQYIQRLACKGQLGQGCTHGMCDVWGEEGVLRRA